MNDVLFEGCPINGKSIHASRWIKEMETQHPGWLQKLYSNLGATLNEAGDEKVAKRLLEIAPPGIESISGRIVRKVRGEIRLVAADRNGSGKLRLNRNSGLNQIGKEIREWREDRGFFTPHSIDTKERRNHVTDGDAMLGKLMLVTSEVAHAAEAVRKGNLRNFKEEIADTMICLLDICGTVGIDIEKTIVRKMERNRNQPKRHKKLSKSDDNDSWSNDRNVVGP
jgi:NTP pyrophosphatase (non-canonical NTP hydrolase)